MEIEFRWFVSKADREHPNQSKKLQWRTRAEFVYANGGVLEIVPAWHDIPTEYEDPRVREVVE